jgi:nucleotide-binding universal stress UspA family protein
MSAQIAIAKNEQTLERSPHAVPSAVGQDRRIKVLIPYDGSENAEAAFNEMRRAGLPQNLDALVAVTNVWLPLSPYEITRAVHARRMKVLSAGASSFTPALRDYEEQRVLSAEADLRVRSIFPSGNVRTEAMQDVAAVANEILRKAKTWGADLIIVGSKTSPSPQITDYAGPALKVAQDAHCAVRIARASDRKDESPIQVVIGVDESDSTARVVEAVEKRIWPAGSAARIVAVRKSGPRDPERDSESALVLERLADRLRAIGLKVSIATRDGQPQDALLREAREISADCIFIDSHGWDHGQAEGFDRGLGKVAVALVLGAHCSVEVVRPKSLTEILETRCLI